MNQDPGTSPLPTAHFDRDDDMLANVRQQGKPQLEIYRWNYTAVVIGRGGHQERELFTAAIDEDNIPLLQRPGGGCSVVLDPGNIIISVGLALPGVGGITQAFRAISNWLITALAHVGIANVRQEGVSDLVLADRKIGGSCVYRTRGLLYYSTTLLVEPDRELVARYLQHPPREPEYRLKRKHEDFMGSLRPSFWSRPADELRKELQSQLRPTLAKLQARCLESAR